MLLKFFFERKLFFASVIITVPIVRKIFIRSYWILGRKKLFGIAVFSLHAIDGLSKFLFDCAKIFVDLILEKHAGTYLQIVD